MKKLMMTMAIAVAVCGCVSSQTIPSGVDSLTAEDVGILVGGAMDQIYRGVNGGRIARKSPNTRIVAKIQPFEVQNLPNDVRAKEVVSELEKRLCKEMSDGGWFFFPDVSGGAASGATLHPDCILKGTLSCQINEKGGSTTSEFSLKLAIADVRTGVVSWEGKVLLFKMSERGSAPQRE